MVEVPGGGGEAEGEVGGDGVHRGEGVVQAHAAQGVQVHLARVLVR